MHLIIGPNRLFEADSTFTVINRVFLSKRLKRVKKKAKEIALYLFDLSGELRPYQHHIIQFAYNVMCAGERVGTGVVKGAEILGHFDRGLPALPLVDVQLDEELLQQQVKELVILFRGPSVAGVGRPGDGDGGLGGVPTPLPQVLELPLVPGLGVLLTCLRSDRKYPEGPDPGSHGRALCRAGAFRRRPFGLFYYGEPVKASAKMTEGRGSRDESGVVAGGPRCLEQHELFLDIPGGGSDPKWGETRRIASIARDLKVTEPE